MKVLVAEDDPLSQFRLQSLLECWGYAPVCVNTGNEAWAILQREQTPQLVILDWMLPGLSGLDVCKLVRSAGSSQYIYVVLLTAKNCPQDVLHGWEAGADDYVLKPFDAHELRARLQAGKRIIGLEKELTRVRDQLRVRASQDRTTSLWSCSAMRDLLNMELARSLADRKAGALCLVALDRIRQIGDTWGCLAAEAVLCQSAQRLASALRPYDVLGRYNSDEFMLVLPGCNETEARHSARRLCAALRQPIEIAEASLTATPKLALVTWNGMQRIERETLLHSLELALREAKHDPTSAIKVVEKLSAPSALLLASDVAAPDSAHGLQRV